MKSISIMQKIQQEKHYLKSPSKLSTNISLQITLDPVYTWSEHLHMELEKTSDVQSIIRIFVLLLLDLTSFRCHLTKLQNV